VARRIPKVCTVLGSGLGSTLALGCAQDLPPSDLIVDERILALRVEAVEADADPVRAEVLPLQRVRIVPWFVGLDGPVETSVVEAEYQPLWIGCALPPLTGLFSCLQSKVPLDASAIPVCPPVDPSALDPSAPLQNPPSPCRLTDAPAAVPEFTVPIDSTFFFGGDLEVTMVAHRPGRGSSEDCLQALLRQEEMLPEECLYATQRVPIGPDDQLFAAAAYVGVDLGDPPPATDPDTHPRITSFAVERFEGDTRIDGPTYLNTPGETVELAAGMSLNITTVAPETDLQQYFTPADEGVWDPRLEDYSGRWFRTWGTLLSPVSNDPTSYNTWEMVPNEAQEEPERPAGNIATMYYVLRDGRQGVDWFWFHVRITE